MAITIPIITEFTGKGLEKAKREFAQLETVGQKAGFVLKKAMLPAAAGAAALGAAAFQAGEALLGMAQGAAEDQAAQKALARTLQSTTKATSSQIALVEDYIDVTQRATGVADDKLRPAYARLIRSTRDTEKAQRLLNLSLNIAGTTGKPLEAIVNALGRAYDGQNTAVGRLGLGIDKATLKGMEFGDLQDRLEKQFRGGASASAETFQGKMARLQIRFSELQETIGYKILPLLERLAEAGIKVMDAFDEGGLGGALQEIQRQSPGFLNFLRNVYNGFAAVGDAIYNVIKLQKAMFDIALARKPDLSFGYYMPKWEDLMQSTLGMGSRGGAAVAPIRGGVPSTAGPLGGTVTPPSTGPMGPQGGVSASSMRPISITVTSADPRAVVDALIKYERQNGAIPVTTR